MDKFDLAQEMDARFRNQALASRECTHKGQSRSHCIDCEEAIPEKRQQLLQGVQRCVLCQEDFERGK